MVTKSFSHQMKIQYLLLPLLAILLSGCSKMPTKVQGLSDDQAAAAREITLALNRATLYNDSLVISSSDPVLYPSSIRLYYDQQYHQALTYFELCHSRYQHTLQSANHSHDSWGKVAMHNGGNAGGMSGHCNCCSNGGHDASVHTAMNNLMLQHTAYHPH